MSRQKKEEAIPAFSLRDAIRVGQTIVNNNAGKPTDKLTLAEWLGYSPKASGYFQLLASSSLYGLTEYDQDKVKLTPLGESHFYPESENERTNALVSAAKNPHLLASLYNHFESNQIPTLEIAKNTLKRTFKVADEKTELLWQNFINDAQYINAIQDIKGKEYLNLSRIGNNISAVSLSKPTTEAKNIDESSTDDQDVIETQQGTIKNQVSRFKVFVSHGKNKKILEQIKTTVEYGDLEPIVAIHEETPAVPVSEKVFDAMHKCNAGIINVSADETIKTKEGEEQYRINENVLIEIGAAFVLYKKKVILVVDERISLPSNLQGLYLCRYKGDSLDWDAGMKLQQALLNFKK